MIDFWEREEFERYVYLIQERESIRLKKEAGEPKPWTEDEILQIYRFTNIRRMDDKVSLWLLNNWYEPYKDHPNMLYAAMLGRFFNLPDALEPITNLVFSDAGWQTKRICASLRIRKECGERIFNNAYMVRGNDGVDKVDTVMNYTIQPMRDNPPNICTDSMEMTWRAIESRYGLGSFMAGQVVADLRWALTGSWSDRNYWAPAGPGSSRGLSRLMGRPLKASMPQSQFLDELSVVAELAKDFLPDSLRGRMEMMDFQSTLCEFDKYERALHGQGKPKQRYPGK